MSKRTATPFLMAMAFAALGATVCFADVAAERDALMKAYPLAAKDALDKSMAPVFAGLGKEIEKVPKLDLEPVYKRFQ